MTDPDRRDEPTPELSGVAHAIEFPDGRLASGRAGLPMLFGGWEAALDMRDHLRREHGHPEGRVVVVRWAVSRDEWRTP